MWTGIAIGIVIGICGMMLFNFAITAFIDGRGKKYQDEIMAIMIEGNELRAEHNEVLSRIADGVNG